MTQYSPKAAIPYAELTDAANLLSYAQGLSVVLDQIVCPTYATRTARDATNPAPTDGDECYVTADKRKYLYYSGQWNNQTIMRGQTTWNFTTQDVFAAVITFPIAFEFAPAVTFNIMTGSDLPRWASRCYLFTTTGFTGYVASPNAGSNQTFNGIVSWTAI